MHIVEYLGVRTEFHRLLINQKEDTVIFFDENGQEVRPQGARRISKSEFAACDVYMPDGRLTYLNKARNWMN